MKIPTRFEGAGLKVLALALAAGLWVAVSADRREQPFERAFDVPVALVGVPNDVIVMTPIQDAVNVRLSGPMSTLRGLSSQNLEVSLDMREARAGSMKLLIRPQSLNLPANVEVVSITPATLTFRLEPRRNKRVAVRPFLVGQLPAGFTHDPADIQVTPPDALVTGPASLIREFDVLFTERIILSGRMATFRQTVSLVSDVPLVRVVEPTSAVVTVPVGLPQPAIPREEPAAAAEGETQR